MAEDFLPYLIDLELMWQEVGEVSWLNPNKVYLRLRIWFRCEKEYIETKFNDCIDTQAYTETPKTYLMVKSIDLFYPYNISLFHLSLNTEFLLF